MKYIKYFESLSMYRKVSNFYDQVKDKKNSNFTKVEIFKIEDKFKDCGFKFPKNLKLSNPNDSRMKILNRINVFYRNKNYGQYNLFQIYKMADEWYYIKDCREGREEYYISPNSSNKDNYVTRGDIVVWRGNSTIWYECDQFDGLLKCINDII